MASRQHVKYGTREGLRIDLEKLIARGYTRCESREKRLPTQFYFAPDMWASPQTSPERFVLIWETEDQS